MAAQLLSPPEHTLLDPQIPMVFLAGPIQGTDDWQHGASEHFLRRHSRLYVANPRREYMDGSFDYSAQVDWESAHLRRAADHGVIFFWLAKESEHHPERAYAQTTRFELAEWVARAGHRKVRIVIGIEDGFSGARYIRHRVGQDRPEIPILDDLETSLAAVDDLLPVSAISIPE